MLMSLKVRIGQTSLLIFWGSQSASTKGRCLWVPESRSWVLSCEFVEKPPGRTMIAA